jgi:lipoate-protein ligase A
MPLHVFQDPASSGEELMARDSELLDLAARNLIEPTLRFYRWGVPTISLGFHQRPDVLDMGRVTQAGIPWVRRPTGGAAVMHSEELTYAIVVPALHDVSGSAKVQEFVGKAIALALSRIGVEATVEERGEPLTALPNRASCFVRTSRWEVGVRGRKLVGSAQRKLGNALLQHGSILTGNDHLRLIEFLDLQNEGTRFLLRERLTAKSTSISTELGHNVPDADLRDALARSFEELYSDFFLVSGERVSLA